MVEHPTGHPGPRRQSLQRVGILILLLILLVLIALMWLQPWKTPQDPVPSPDGTALPTITPPTETEVSTEPTPTSEPAATSVVCLDNVCRHEWELPDTPGTRLEMIDDSIDLNWSVPTEACLADIATFMNNEGIAMELVSFTLQDALPETGTPVFFQFPPSTDPINDPSPDESTAMCSLDAGSERIAYCRVAVTRIDSEMNDNARLSLILAAMDALRRVHYEQVTEDLEGYYLALAEELDRFEPVVREEDGAWTTNCWELLE